MKTRELDHLVFASPLSGSISAEYDPSRGAFGHWHHSPKGYSGEIGYGRHCVECRMVCRIWQCCDHTTSRNIVSVYKHNSANLVKPGQKFKRARRWPSLAIRERCLRVPTCILNCGTMARRWIPKKKKKKLYFIQLKTETKKHEFIKSANRRTGKCPESCARQRHQKLSDWHWWHHLRRCTEWRAERMVTCEPYPDALEIINKWYDEGTLSLFFHPTEEHRTITETWLNKHGFKYHGILLCKPWGGNYHWIDNHLVKATRFKGKVYRPCQGNSRNWSVSELISIWRHLPD